MTSEKFRRFVMVDQYAVLFDGEVEKIHDNTTDNFSIKWFQQAHWKESLSRLNSVVTNHINDVSKNKQRMNDFSPNIIIGNLVKISYYFKPTFSKLEHCLIPSHITYNVINTESCQSRENLKICKDLKYTSVRMWNYILVITISGLSSENMSENSEITDQKFIQCPTDKQFETVSTSERRMHFLKTPKCYQEESRLKRNNSLENESPIKKYHYCTRSEHKRKCISESAESASDNSEIYKRVSVEELRQISICDSPNAEKAELNKSFTELVKEANESPTMDFSKYFLRQRPRVTYNLNIASQSDSSDLVVAKLIEQTRIKSRKKITNVEKVQKEDECKSQVLNANPETSPVCNGPIIKPQTFQVCDIAKLFNNAGFKNVTYKAESQNKSRKNQKYGAKRNIKSRTSKQKRTTVKKQPEVVQETCVPHGQEQLNNSLDTSSHFEEPKISLTDYNQSTSIEIYEEIKKIKDVKLLTPIHLLYLIKRNEEYLRNVYKGVIPSDRHQEYLAGGLKRVRLKYRVNVEHFTDAQLDIINNLLMEVFKKSNPRFRSKFIDYMLTVLLPEILKKIFVEVTGITTEDAEDIMSGNLLSPDLEALSWKPSEVTLKSQKLYIN